MKITSLEMAKLCNTVRKGDLVCFGDEFKFEVAMSPGSGKYFLFALNGDPLYFGNHAVHTRRFFTIIDNYNMQIGYAKDEIAKAMGVSIHTGVFPIAPNSQTLLKGIIRAYELFEMAANERRRAQCLLR